MSKDDLFGCQSLPIPTSTVYSTSPTPTPQLPNSPTPAQVLSRRPKDLLIPISPVASRMKHLQISSGSPSHAGYSQSQSHIWCDPLNRGSRDTTLSGSPSSQIWKVSHRFSPQPSRCKRMTFRPSQSELPEKKKCKLDSSHTVASQFGPRGPRPW